MKSKFTKLLTRWDILAVAGVFILVLVISYLTFYTPNYYTANAPVTFDITKGESFSSVVERLFEQGIIP
jgi:cell division protein YceG involved in septum cleavage